MKCLPNCLKSSVEVHTSEGGVCKQIGRRTMTSAYCPLIGSRSFRNRVIASETPKRIFVGGALGTHRTLSLIESIKSVRSLSKFSKEPKAILVSADAPYVTSEKTVSSWLA